MDTLNPEETIFYLVGISQYTDKGFHDLPAAQSNINALSDVLIKRLGFSSSNVVIKNFRTTKEMIREEIRDHVKNENVKNFFFYFSGHCSPDSSDEYVLVLKDTPLDDLVGKGITPGYLFDAMKPNNREINLIIILDCCFSQAGFKDFRSNSQYIIASSSEDSPSVYPVGDKFSSFTKLLLDVLEGGIQEGNAFLTLEDIFSHIRHQIENKNDKVSNPSLEIPLPEKSTSGELGKQPFLKNNSFGLKKVSKYSDNDVNALNIIFEGIAKYKKEYKSKRFESIEGKKKAILGEFPYPLAYHLNHLIPKNGNLIKSELETCYHRTLEFTCFVFVSQFLAIQPRNEKEQNEELLTLVVNQSEDNLYKIIDLIAPLLLQHNHSELIFDESHLWMISLRDNFERIGKCLIDNDCVFDVAYKYLIELYHELAFFSKYLLFSVRLIDVNFRKYHDKRIYIHEASLLEGERLTPYTKEIDILHLETPKKLSLNWEIYKNSNSVLLTSYEDIELKKYLNLWPFVIDCTVYQRKDDYVKYVPEIRMFAGKKKGQYLYKGVEFDPMNSEKAFRDIDVISPEIERISLCERFENDLKMHGIQAK